MRLFILHRKKFYRPVYTLTSQKPACQSAFRRDWFLKIQKLYSMAGDFTRQFISQYLQVLCVWFSGYRTNHLLFGIFSGRYFFILFLLMSLPFYAGGKKTTIKTYRTEFWTEEDFIGSGFHLTLDRIRPNIWVIVHKVDGEEKDWVGLPNNVSAGSAVDWSSLSYDRLNPYSRIPSDPVASLDPATGKCRTDGRCYGDFINNDELWQDSLVSYQDVQNQPFLLLREQMNGQKKTRYRFDVFVEDNQPYWLKDENGQYVTTNSKIYYPLSRVVFRLTDFANPPGGASGVPANDDKTDQDEFYILKEGEDLLVENSPVERRLRNGSFVFNFTIYHSFQEEKAYFIMVTARDMEGNSRTLRVPIQMGALSGITIHNRNVEGVRQ